MGWLALTSPVTFNRALQMYTPLLPLSEDFVQRNPRLREPLLAAAAAVLSSIAKTGNILLQFFRKGFAVMEVEVDYDYQPRQGTRRN